MASIPTKMKALRQHAKEGPDAFKVEEIDVPKPKSNEVLIKVHAASLNPIDLKRGHFIQDSYPLVMGYDVAGEIVVVGEDVKDFFVGDRVFGEIMPGAIDPKEYGTVSEYCTALPRLLANLPSEVAYENAAALPLAVQTVMQSFESLGWKEGESLFISAGAGGVGTHALQLAKSYYKCKPIATTASGQKIAFVKALGADIVVDYKHEDVGEKLGGWADMAIDCVGDLVTTKKILKEGGRMKTIVDASSPDFLMMVPNSDRLQIIAKLVVDHNLMAIIDTIYPLEDAVKAVEHMAGGRARGKIVIKVSD